MTVHEKINDRMRDLVGVYYAALIHVDLTPKQIANKLRLPKHLTHGGDRNTCYQWR